MSRYPTSYFQDLARRLEGLRPTERFKLIDAAAHGLGHTRTWVYARLHEVERLRRPGRKAG